MGIFSIQVILPAPFFAFYESLTSVNKASEKVAPPVATDNTKQNLQPLPPKL
ncbi:MAG TPA: hypothetical protein VJU78_20880 [Chitinophagaceae bacterium]|nr:hypothetical protein [Chitinophagaceae bacterium]